MFTRQSLRHLANDNSFQRGQAYYDAGAVRKLRREANTFQAQVKGTRTYRTELLLAPTGPKFECNCPYDFDGICKHAVALGLAVLEAYGSNLTSQESREHPAVPKRLGAAVAAAWASHPTADKLRFLEQALAKSDDLARQFLGFVGQPVPASGPDPLVILDTLAERLTDTLSTLEFDEELWESSGGNGGYDEGEALEEASAEVVREALAGFVSELLGLARGGQLTAALRYWATACAAIYQVDEPGSDDYGLFGDYGTEVLAQWHEQLHPAGWPAVLLSAVVPPAELEAGLHWLDTYLIDPPTRWPDFEASWLPLLLALAADPAAAPLLLAHLEKVPLSADTQARLRLQLARTLANDADWVQTAETLLPQDAAVAQQLLNYYTCQADRPALLRTAAKALAIWPDHFGGYVLNTFTAAQAPDLYRDALRHRTQANHSLDDFGQLRPLLMPAEITALVETAVAAAQDGRGSVAFAAELLAREASPVALTEFVLGLEWIHISPPYHAEIAMMRLAEVDPTALMLALETRVRAYLGGHAGAKRGAFLYDRIGRWLVSVRGTAPRLTEPVLRLALELRQEFPTLSGLRQVLRDEGFLPMESTGAPHKRGK
ncbi:SWIM zinc finger family protein [Hymenobacter elongatus]|uniref:SWIM-type domain-containing protein n=1 Tax=Hymenobacter elongatus TaxID=877208 RepID=A0A4Z0PQS5_9BACT|nr:hypothetical protein [Hymenobacter elongatus]TGE17535.1 hypothetical protein E5J99_06695 [Hymenobacter elongatus]